MNSCQLFGTRSQQSSEERNLNADPVVVQGAALHAKRAAESRQWISKARVKISDGASKKR